MMTPNVEGWFTGLVWATVVIQCILTVMDHYTMDVVISEYLTPLLWSFYTMRMECEEMQPSH